MALILSVLKFKKAFLSPKVILTNNRKENSEYTYKTSIKQIIFLALWAGPIRIYSIKIYPIIIYSSPGEGHGFNYKIV